MVPEASLTLSALFSGAPSPSLLLQGKWKPLSHPLILPCPHSTPWRIFQQPPSCLPVSWPFMTSPSGREGETSKRIYIPAGQAEGGRLGSQGPSPQSWAHMHTETPLPHKHRSIYTNPQGQGAWGPQTAQEEDTHTKDTCSSFIENKSQTSYKIQITNLQGWGQSKNENTLADESNVSKSSRF